MPKGFFKTNVAQLNNELGQENRRMKYINKLKNKVEEKNGQPLTTLRLKHAINESVKSGTLIMYR